MLPEIDEVTASYQRCRAEDAFLDTFYDLFLSKSPEVAYRFRNTDFRHQKLMLRESLVAMLLFNLGVKHAQEELQRLGDRHSRRGVDIPPHLYPLWLDALCEAVQKHDPEYEPPLEEKWRNAMRAGIELLISKY